MHTDRSAVTLNVCLGKEFTGILSLFRLTLSHFSLFPLLLFVSPLLMYYCLGGNLVFKGIKGTSSENVEHFEYAHVVGKVFPLQTSLPLSLLLSCSLRGLLPSPPSSSPIPSPYLSLTPLQGLLHLGKHVHQADNITTGERYNLIVWCRSK